MALVCDAEGPSGIAGIMGGQISEVSDKTTRVLMEAATWVGPNIMRTSKALGLRTEASARFEKQLHPEQAIAAQRLAARLMVELCGARMVPGTRRRLPGAGGAARGGRCASSASRGCWASDIEPAASTDPRAARLRAAPDGGWRGAALARRRRAARGRPDRGGGAHPRPRQAARPRCPRAAAPVRRGSRRSQRLRRRLEDALRDRGLHECISYSFTSPARARAAAARRRARCCASRTRSARSRA